MAPEQSMTSAITQAAIQATKAAIMAVREAEAPAKHGRPLHIVPRGSGLALRQPPFHWKAQDKYNELNNFKINVRNTSLMKL